MKNTVLIAFGYSYWSLNDATYRFKFCTAESGRGDTTSKPRANCGAYKTFLKENHNKYIPQKAWQARGVYSSARCICINVKTIQICYQHEDSCSSDTFISDNDVQY